ncbi:MAG: hypothetical protein V1799_16520 [bacterium]
MKAKKLLMTAYLQLGYTVLCAGLAFGSYRLSRYLMKCAGGG